MYDTGQVADIVYEQLEPVAQTDASQGYALQLYVGAICDELLQEIDDYASDSANGQIGWSMVLDLDRAPAKVLTWLAQFVGIDFPAGLTEAQQRQVLEDKANFERGTPNAIRAAAQLYLTGNKQVVIYERDLSPYHFAVITRTGETPDQAKILAALLAAKPAGLQMTYNVIPGIAYNELDALQTTYDNLDAAGWTNYNDLENGVIGG